MRTVRAWGLAAALAGAGCGSVNVSTGGGAAASASQSVYASTDPIVVNFSGLPGNDQDWINVVESSAPDDVYGNYEYTRGRRSGMMTFPAVAAGNYQVRVYYNWPEGGFTVQSRTNFTVR